MMILRNDRGRRRDNQQHCLLRCCIHPSDTHVLHIADLIHRRPAAERDACSRLKVRAASCFPNQPSHMQKCPSVSELRTAQQCLSRMGRPLPSRSCAFITADGRSVQSTPSHLSSIAENARWAGKPYCDEHCARAFQVRREASAPGIRLSASRIPNQASTPRTDAAFLATLINPDPLLQSVPPMGEVCAGTRRAGPRS